MDLYTTLVCVLAVIFTIVLSLVVILAIQLRRRYFEQLTKKSVIDEPFTPQERESLTKQQLKRLASVSEELEKGRDNVFEEQEISTIDASQVSFSLYHNPGEDILVLDIWSVSDTPPDFIKGYVEAQLFPSDFEAGQFHTSVREPQENIVVFNESFGIPNVSSDMIANVYLKLFLFKTYGVITPKCVGHTVFALNDVPWNPFGKTQFKQELRRHEMVESPSTPAMTTDEESPVSSPSRANKGELYISLRYQRKSGRINVVVLKGENIQRGNVLQSGKELFLMAEKIIC